MLDSLLLSGERELTECGKVGKQTLALADFAGRKWPGSLVNAGVYRRRQPKTRQRVERIPTRDGIARAYLMSDVGCKVTAMSHRQREFSALFRDIIGLSFSGLDFAC